jgi:hypothetical protein
MNVTEGQAVEWIEKISEKNELIATLKAQLEAVTSERDYLRSVVSAQPPFLPNDPYWFWHQYGPIQPIK